ncbi:MAG: hypothetical protein KF778_09640 [Rhodocyclaceae bacterium]|nr:hypothetical protein [Rhodocyclaceae bacterium]MBX3668651.1 hypothetical protein [Rhodocyclaceae bacterium]
MGFAEHQPGPFFPKLLGLDLFELSTIFCGAIDAPASSVSQCLAKHRAITRLHRLGSNCARWELDVAGRERCVSRARISWRQLRRHTLLGPQASQMLREQRRPFDCRCGA